LKSGYSYFNIGYILLGSVVEKIFQEPFEKILTREIILPLEINSAGFGMPQLFTGIESIKQPIGHTDDKDFDYKQNYDDNLPLLSPAGRLHCSVIDFAKYLQFYLVNYLQIRNESYLKPLLYGIQPMNFPMGWRKKYNGELDMNIWWQTGSNMFFYTAMCIVPDQNIGVFVLNNHGGQVGSTVCREVINKLLESVGMPPL
jgi:CubicO group peptidase (beta-lactamase class C family)